MGTRHKTAIAVVTPGAAVVDRPGGDRGSASPWRDPGPAGERLQVEDFPTFLFSRLATVAKSRLTSLYLDDTKLGLPEWRLLTFISLFSPTSYPVLAQRMAMDKGQISLTLRILVARGWVTWKDAAANDRPQRRQARIITITPRGRAVIDGIMPAARRAQVKLLDRLPRDERIQLHALLKKALAILDSIDSEPAG